MSVSLLQPPAPFRMLEAAALKLNHFFMVREIPLWCPHSQAPIGSFFWGMKQPPRANRGFILFFPNRNSGHWRKIKHWHLSSVACPQMRAEALLSRMEGTGGHWEERGGKRTWSPLYGSLQWLKREPQIKYHPWLLTCPLSSFASEQLGSGGAYQLLTAQIREWELYFPERVQRNYCERRFGVWHVHCASFTFRFRLFQAWRLYWMSHGSSPWGAKRPGHLSA